MGGWIEWVGIAASVALPLFNIPLILHVIKRKSSDDYSLSWTIGVWSCIVLMTPQALRSADPAFKIFGIVNLVFFSLVAFFILKYRSKPKTSTEPNNLEPSGGGDPS
jgi:uncharacterized protein with PQ loop repeat